MVGLGATLNDNSTGTNAKGLPVDPLDILHEHDITLDNLVCDFTGYLTADLADARAVHETEGGYLFRMGDLYLVCGHEDALGWGWTEEELERLPFRAPARNVAQL